MWKAVLNLAGSARRLLNAAREWSRPIRVAGYAIADVRRTKAELIAENALLRQQLIAAKRHLGRPRLANPEKLAITLWSRLTTRWQSTILLFQPLVLQARVKFANGEMGKAFRSWYPNFSASDNYAEEELLAA